MELIQQMCDYAYEELRVQYPLNTNIVEKQILREPVGTAFIISCWNYPIYGPATLLIPALIAGNSVLIKPSRHTANLGSVYEEFSSSIGYVNLVSSALLNFETCEKVIRNPQIGVCFFMGTFVNGKQILKEASHSNLHKVILELEGKDAAYIDKSCAIQQSVDSIVNGMFQNAGQSYHSIKRLYLHKDISDEMIQMLVNKIEQLKLGNPNDRQMGPIKLNDIIDQGEKFIEQSKLCGGKVIIGGNRYKLNDFNGLFYQPTLILGAGSDSLLMTHELQGPICGIEIIDNYQKGLELINQSKFGLSCSIYSEDIDISKKMADSLNVGTVYINKYQDISPQLPWSGRKQSGRSFTQSKRVFDQVTQYKSIHYIY